MSAATDEPSRPALVWHRERNRMRGDIGSVGEVVSVHWRRSNEYVVSSRLPGVPLHTVVEGDLEVAQAAAEQTVAEWIASLYRPAA